MDKRQRKSKSTTAPADSDSTRGMQREEIRCAMTDEQYHDVINELSAIDGMLELVQPRAGDQDIGMIIGLRVISEKLKAAQVLMSAAWDRTREASHG